MKTLAWSVLALLVAAGSAWGLLRDRVGRSVLQHPVVEVFRSTAEEEGWTLLLDDIRRPGAFEPLWLAGMMGQPWKRVLVYRTDRPPASTGPLVERLLFGEPGAAPDGPVDGIVWRMSSTLPALPSDARIELDRDGPRGSFVGHADGVTFLDRARRLTVAVAGEELVVIVEGGARHSGGDGYGHPLRNTGPYRWGPAPPDRPPREPHERSGEERRRGGVTLTPPRRPRPLLRTSS